MIIRYDDAARVAEVWLSHADQQTPDIQKKLDRFCAEQKSRKYKVVIFESGTKNLVEATKELLYFNSRI